jgi:hypothetical protein
LSLRSVCLNILRSRLSWLLMRGLAIDQQKESSLAAPAAGTEFVFEIGIKLVERQLDRIDRLDAKVGTLWGLLGATIIWLLKASAGGELPALPRGLYWTFTIGVLFFTSGFILALLALVPRQYSFPVNYREMVNQGEKEANAIRYNFVSGILEAYEGNLELIKSKARLLQAALWLSAGGILLAGFALAAMTKLKQ